MYSCVFDKLGSIILHFKFYFILVELKFSIIDHVSIILKKCARFGCARIFLFHQDLCSIYQSFLDILWQAMMIDQWHNDKQAMFLRLLGRFGTTGTMPDMGAWGWGRMLPWWFRGVYFIWKSIGLPVWLLRAEPAEKLVAPWTPPIAPPYKINVDGSDFAAQITVRDGVLIRAGKGSMVVVAISKK